MKPLKKRDTAGLKFAKGIIIRKKKKIAKPLLIK